MFAKFRKNDQLKHTLMGFITKGLIRLNLFAENVGFEKKNIKECPSPHNSYDSFTETWHGSNLRAKQLVC